MSRTFSKLISENDLAEILLKTAGIPLIPGKTARETIDYDEEPIVYVENTGNIYVSNPNYVKDAVDFLCALLYGDKSNDYALLLDKPAFSKFKKDISKVHFDYENVEAIGLRTLPNGLVYYAFSAGGDWEHPVYVIAYYDGKSIRGYVPTDGNPWNTSTNWAYGNDWESGEEDSPSYETDEVNCMKRFGVIAENYDSKFDIQKIEADITARILKKG